MNNTKIRCTFAGHSEIHNSNLVEAIKTTAKELITEYGVNEFWVGHYGDFDHYAAKAVRELKQEYPRMHYAVVLAYMPGRQTEYEDHSDTMLPEGIEAVHPRYAISWRNSWMLNRSEYVVTYITHTWGGATQYAKKAKAKGKICINLVL